MTDTANATVQAHLVTFFEGRFLAPLRHTTFWLSHRDKSEWQRRAATFLEDHPAFVSTAWVTPDGSVTAVPSGWQSVLGRDLPPVSTGTAPSGPWLSSHVTGPNGVMVRRIVVPILSNDSTPRLLGYGIAAFPEQQSLQIPLEHIRELGYSIALLENGNEVYRLAEFPAHDSAYVSQKPLQFAGLHWTVAVWPNQALITNMHSHLAEFIYVMGSVLALLVSAITFFALFVRTKNQILVAEIAEHRRTDHALKSSQARLNGILETSVDGIVAVDAQQRIVLYNKGAEAIFGYTFEEVAGEPLSLLIPATAHSVHRRHVETFGASSAERPRRMAGPREVFGRKKDATEFPVEASISKLDTPEGVIYTSIVRDVTGRVRVREELRQAHEELEQRVQERTAELAIANEQLRHEVEERELAEVNLRRSEGRMQSILDNCTASIFMKDMQGRYLLINRWYETLFSVRKEDIVGKTDFDFLPAEIAARFRQDDEVVMRTESPIEFEETIAHPDGSIHTYIAAKFIVRDANDQPYALCGIAADITRQKQAEELLSELSGGLMALQDEERKRLARELHEGTAQMLAALEMNLELAKRLAREESQKVKSALDTSLELVEQSATQVRTMSYLLHPPGLDDFGVGPALRWYADGFSSRSGIKVGVNISTDVERFERNIELAIFRIVQEALTNIIRHSGSKTAEISLRQRESEIELEIADHGHGMQPDLLQRMSSGKTVPGIGIAGIRERVRQLGGVFGIHSGSDGVRLIATLPVKSSARAAKSAALNFLN
jgi:PAS domain S-box-containing protein